MPSASTTSPIPRANHYQAYVLLSFLFFLSTTTTAFSFWEEKVTAFEADQTKTNIIVSALGNIVIAYSAFLIVKAKKDRRKCLAFAVPFLPFMLFGLVSCAWSDFPYVALKRWTKVAIYLSVFLTFMTFENPKFYLRKLLLNYIAAGVIGSLVLLIIVPEYGTMVEESKVMLCGLFTHKNSLGSFSAYALLLMPYMYRSAQKKSEQTLFLVLGIICAVLLFLADSKTALCGYLLSLVVYLVIVKIGIGKNDSPRAHFKWLGTAGIAVGSILLVVYLNEQFFGAKIVSIVLSIVGKDPTFTGRQSLWEMLVYFGIRDHLWRGVGFGTFFVGEKSAWLLPYLGWQAPNAHNGFVQIFLELGLIGLVLAVVSLVVVFARILNKNALSHLPEIVAVFVLFIIENIFEVGMFAISLQFFFFLLLFACAIAGDNERQRIT